MIDLALIDNIVSPVIYTFFAFYLLQEADWDLLCTLWL